MKFLLKLSPNGCSLQHLLKIVGMESAGYAMVEGQNYFDVWGTQSDHCGNDTFSSNISSTINSSTTTSTQVNPKGVCLISGRYPMTMRPLQILRATGPSAYNRHYNSLL